MPPRRRPSKFAFTTSTRPSTSSSRSKFQRGAAWAPWLLLGAVSLGLFVAALDTYVVVTLLPKILFDLDLPVDRIERATPMLTGFLAGYIVTMPLLGLASDIHGRAAVYLGSLAVFVIGSVLTATAAYTGEPPYGIIGQPWLVSGRVLQGLGGGAMVPIALALAADLFPEGRRDTAIGGVAAIQETGSVLGPLYGAAIARLATDYGDWRATFWLNVPLAAICAACFLIATRGVGRERTANRVTSPRQVEDGLAVDWLGAVLLGAGLAALAVALYPDDPAKQAVSTNFLPWAAAAVLALGGWGYRQFAALNPVIPSELLRSRPFLGSSFANLLVGAGLMTALVDIPLMGRAVFNLNQVDSALLLSRFMVAIPVGAVGGGFLSQRLGGRWTAVLGLLLAASGFYLISLWGAGELSLRLGILRQADVELALCGLGFGLVIAPLAGAVINLARPERHGLAASLVVLVRTLGMMAGLSALSAFGLRRFYDLFNSGYAPRLVPGPDFLHQKLLFEQKLTASLVAEYHGIFLIAAGLCVVAGVVAGLTLSARSTAGTTTAST